MTSTLCDKISGPCGQDECLGCLNRSFASHNLMNFWDKKNSIDPKTILKTYRKKCLFTCPSCDHTFEDTPDNMIHKKNPCQYCAEKALCDDQSCQVCFDHSFLSDKHSQYWNHEKNDKPPRKVLKNSNNGAKYWFDCNVCNHSMKITLNSIFTNKTWCLYCITPGRYLCDKDDCEMCFKKSFASSKHCDKWNYTLNGETTPRQVFKLSDKSFFLDCPKCLHTFKPELYRLNKDEISFCPYCGLKKLCSDQNCQWCFDKSFASCEKSKFLKDTGIDPRKLFKGSQKKYEFVCQFCHKDLVISLTNATSNHWCVCKINKTENLIFQYLVSINHIFDNKLIEREKKFSWSKSQISNMFYRFDFYFQISGQGIVLENDGRGHFEDVEHWSDNSFDRQNIDAHKMLKCFENNIIVIRISQEDIWEKRIDWKNELLKAFTTRPYPQVQYISKNEDLYCDMKKILMIRSMVGDIVKNTIL